MSSPVPASPGLGPITRVGLAIAAIGFLFDTYGLLMFPVIGSDAVGDSSRSTRTAARQDGGPSSA